MELDFIPNINEFEENVVRLYNFDKSESAMFRDLIREVIIEKGERLDLSQFDFIEGRNCNLILVPFRKDEGIVTQDTKTFFCALTKETFIKMLGLLEPFCDKNRKSHQFLYDLDNPIDFLFSPAGTW